MKLFDEGERTDTRLKRHAEAEFDYLNQSARPAVIALRPVFEEWFSLSPLQAQADLRSRFRSSDDYAHASAFFELYLNELLMRIGCKVVAHPPLPDLGTHPDFHLTRDDGCEFYLEATLAGIPKREDQGAQARIEQVYEVLDRLNSPNFFLRVAVTGAPSTPPPGRELQRKLEEWLRTINVEGTFETAASGEFDDLPILYWEHSGWNVEIMAVPKSPVARGKPGIRPIGVIAPEAQWLQTDRDMKKALETRPKNMARLDCLS